MVKTIGFFSLMYVMGSVLGLFLWFDNLYAVFATAVFAGCVIWLWMVDVFKEEDEQNSE